MKILKHFTHLLDKDIRLANGVIQNNKKIIYQYIIDMEIRNTTSFTESLPSKHHIS